MALRWSFRRQLLYYGVALVVLLVLSLLVYETFFTATPTCFDGKQNGDERGIDCGGNRCALVCAAESRAPVVLWSRAFRSSPQSYTAAVYIQNLNQGSQAVGVPYSLQLFDEKNLLVVEITGSLDIPPVQTVPLLVPNINTGERNVSRVLFAFSGAPVWNRSGALPVLRIQNQKLLQDSSSLSATVYNDSNIEARQVIAVAVLFDAQGIARAASRSVIPGIARKASQPVVFTWNGGVPGIIRAEITVLPPL